LGAASRPPQRNALHPNYDGIISPRFGDEQADIAAFRVELRANETKFSESIRFSASSSREVLHHPFAAHGHPGRLGRARVVFFS